MVKAMETPDPCKFCGSNDSHSERLDFATDYRVCNDCGARGPLVDVEDAYEEPDGEKIMEARTIAAWNRSEGVPAETAASDEMQGRSKATDPAARAGGLMTHGAGELRPRSCDQPCPIDCGKPWPDCACRRPAPVLMVDAAEFERRIAAAREAARAEVELLLERSASNSVGEFLQRWKEGRA